MFESSRLQNVSVLFAFIASLLYKVAKTGLKITLVRATKNTKEKEIITSNPGGWQPFWNGKNLLKVSGHLEIEKIFVVEIRDSQESGQGGQREKALVDSTSILLICNFKRINWKINFHAVYCLLNLNYFSLLLLLDMVRVGEFYDISTLVDTYNIKISISF